jgi:hypothetical protein
MSHYSVMVCLPAETTDIEKALGEVLSPFDEDKDVEPYRDYEEGGPEDFWWVSAVRRGAADHAANASVEIRESFLGGDKGVWSNRAGRYLTKEEYTEEELADRADDALWAERLGERPGWREVVLHYNAKYHPGNELAVPGGEPEEFDGLWYDPETDRAYKMSTYNPDSKWDYWRIGGRWSGYFVADGGAQDIIAPQHHWDGPKNSKYPGHTVCDGGRKRDVDFATMREVAAVEAEQRYFGWESLLAEYGPTKAWSHFTGLVDVSEITIDEARRQYNEQPLIAAHHRMEREGNGLAGWLECPVETFKTTREEYVRLARIGAIPAYATLTLSGEWAAPGRMGWFGMSSDGPGEREGYDVAINRYLDELRPNTWLVVVDCHI